MVNITSLEAGTSRPATIPAQYAGTNDDALRELAQYAILTIEPMTGPGTPARCILCHAAFADSDLWQRYSRDGVHLACLAGGAR